MNVSRHELQLAISVLHRAEQFWKHSQDISEMGIMSDVSELCAALDSCYLAKNRFQVAVGKQFGIRRGRRLRDAQARKVRATLYRQLGLLPAEALAFAHEQDAEPRVDHDLLAEPLSLSGPDSPPDWVKRRQRRCYVCKEQRDDAPPHHFYDSMCYACGEFNYNKRSQTADLRGRVAMVTGGRIRIGFEVAIKLLQAGARVAVTTRFPADALLRFSQHPEFEVWRDRLRIYALDLRFLREVEEFAQEFTTRYERLDVLINCAAQTIRRPSAFYAPQRFLETMSRACLPHPETIAEPPHKLAIWDAQQAAIEDKSEKDQMAKYFPQNRFDEHNQPLDLRPQNSWSAGLCDISTVEVAEVHAVNCIAPFVLIRGLTPLMERTRKMLQQEFKSPTDPVPWCWIVNVTAMEGKKDCLKPVRHPHTNMAKAALNMLTQTSAPQYASKGILMSATDTSWNTVESPCADQLGEFQAPLDEVDGAARILDPVFRGINEHWIEFGRFLKDYHPTTW